MSDNNEKLSLSDFFTYEHQCKLIREAQMIDANYENAIIEYAKLFMADLIKSMCSDNDSEHVNLIDRFISSTSHIHIYPAAFNPDKKEKPLSEIDVSPITEFFLRIREVYHCWTSCNVNTAIEVLKVVFEKNLQVSASDKKEVPKSKSLYRGRLSEKPLEKADMFHIPFMKAYRIRNQRFSITGQPLLYLSSDVHGVFNELSVNDNNYETLYITQYRFKQYDEKKMYVYDLTIDGSQLFQQSDFDSFSKNMYRFMLSCVCSFPNVRWRDNSFFVEEYVIPQLVTQYIKKSPYSYNGVCYNTAIYGNCMLESTECGTKDKANTSANNPQKSRETCGTTEKYLNYAFFTERCNSNESMDLVLRDYFIIDEPVTLFDIPGYNSKKHNCYSKDIIELFSKYYEHISSIATVPHEIMGSKYFKQLKKEVDWIYRDGKYRYIRKKALQRQGDDK